LFAGLFFKGFIYTLFYYSQTFVYFSQIPRMNRSGATTEFYSSANECTD